MVLFLKIIRRVFFYISCNKLFVVIYCLCRMLYDKEEYVQCSYRCRVWYYIFCVNILEWVINSGRKWKCGKCREVIKY